MTGTDHRDQAMLRRDLESLGLPVGANLLVHCSMRRLGPIAGGPATLYAALRQAVGPSATIVVPTHTSNNSNTSTAFREATRGMNAEQLARFEAAMPGFDPMRTPSYRMGALAEHVRQLPVTVRSRHPQTSFAAIGPDAAKLVEVHDLGCHLGERSPLGALYHAQAWIVLLGVGYHGCTAFHLAEYWSERVPSQTYRCYVTEHGRRQRRDFTAPRLDDSDFDALGADLDRELFVGTAKVGNGLGRLMPLAAAVDFARHWMATHRSRVWWQRE